MGFRNSDKGLGFGLGQAILEVLDADSGINEHGNGAGFEYGKGQCEKFEARFNHERRADTPADAASLQPLCDPVAFAVQLPEGIMGVSNPPVWVAARRKLTAALWGRFLAISGR